MKLKEGDIVIPKRQEDKMIGIVVGWHYIWPWGDEAVRVPVISWSNGVCKWILTEFLEKA